MKIQWFEFHEAEEYYATIQATEGGLNLMGVAHLQFGTVMAPTGWELPAPPSQLIEEWKCRVMMGDDKIWSSPQGWSRMTGGACDGNPLHDAMGEVFKQAQHMVLEIRKERLKSKSG